MGFNDIVITTLPPPLETEQNLNILIMERVMRHCTVYAWVLNSALLTHPVQCTHGENGSLIYAYGRIANDSKAESER